MKRLVLLIAIVAVSFLGFSVMRKCLSWSRSGNMLVGHDLFILNDSNDPISIAFNKEGKMVSEVINPGSSMAGGCGFVRVFVKNKTGEYTVEYAYPRPKGKLSELSVGQILTSVHNPNLNNELYIEKGRIGDDIKVTYEEVRTID